MVGTYPGADDAATGRYRFGDIVVDAAAHTVLRAGELQAVEPKAFAVLLGLLQRPGELIGRDDLLDRVWGHRHVTPGVLTRAIAQLRHALDDDTHHPRYIQTQHALGYRFVGMLEADAAFPSADGRGSADDVVVEASFETETRPAVADIDASSALPAPVAGASSIAIAEVSTAAADAGTGKGWRRTSLPWRRIATGTALLAVVAVAFVIVGREIAPPPLADSSIAVLPFSTLTDDKSDRYFAEGLAVEMHDVLAGVPGLKVAAHPSLGHASQGSQVEMKALGRALGVATVLDASVRREGSQVRINARLSNTRTGFILWTESYDREMADVFALQTEIANEVVRELLGVLPGERETLAKRLAPTKNPEAYDAYLEGLGRLQQSGSAENLAGAVGFFNEALAADGGFARAQAGICRAQIQRFESARDADAYSRAEMACRRAGEMDPDLREVSLALGDLHRAHDEPAKAIEQYNKALEHPALAADAMIGIARTHGASGRHDLAMDHFERAHRLRPGDGNLHRHMGYQHLLNGDPARAIASYRKALTLLPGDAKLWRNLGGAYMTNGEAAHAADAFKRSLAIEPSYVVLSNLGTLRYQAGEYAEAAKLYRHAAKLNPDDYRIWGNLGDALSARPETAAQARAPYQRAATMAERYISIKSSDAPALVTLAWYRANLGDAGIARQLVSRAESLGTEAGEVAFSAAQTLALLGDVDAARERVRRAQAAGVPANQFMSSPILARLDVIGEEKTRIP